MKFRILLFIANYRPNGGPTCRRNWTELWLFQFRCAASGVAWPHFRWARMKKKHFIVESHSPFANVQCQTRDELECRHAVFLNKSRNNSSHQRCAAHWWRECDSCCGSNGSGTRTAKHDTASVRRRLRCCPPPLLLLLLKGCHQVYYRLC